MAVTILSAAAVYSTGNPAPTTPTRAAGDLMLVLVGTKPDNTPATTPAGYTLLGAASGGAGTTGIDTGPMRVGVFYRIADGTAADVVPAITVTGNNVSAAQVFRVRSDIAGAGWDIAGVGAADTTTGAAHSVTMPSNPGITARDFLLAVGVIPTDVGGGAQFSAETVSATGLTTLTLTESNEWFTSSGQDMGGWVASGTVVSGAATAAPTVSATASGTTTNVAGPIFLVRAREVIIKAGSESNSIAVSESTDIAGITVDKVASETNSLSLSESTDIGGTFIKSASETVGLRFLENRYHSPNYPVPNILPNPSFEDGTSTGWSAAPGYPATFTSSVVPVTDAYDGNYVLQITITGAGNFAIQTDPAAISQIVRHYNGARARQTAGTLKTFYVYTINYDIDGTTQTGSNVDSKAMTSSWVQAGLPNNPLAQPSDIVHFRRLRLHVPSAQVGDVYEFDAAQISLDVVNGYTLYDPMVRPEFSAISVSESTSIAVEKSASDTGSIAASEIRQRNIPGQNNLVWDGSFESGDGGWTSANANQSLSWVELPCYDGTHMLRATQDIAATGTIMSQRIPIKPNTQYSARFAYRRNGSTSQSPNTRLQTLLANGNFSKFVNPTWSISNTTGDTWIIATMTLTSDPNDHWIEVSHAILQTNLGETQDFDKFEVVEGPTTNLGLDPITETFHTKGAHDTRSLALTDTSVPNENFPITNIVSNPSFETDTTGWVAEPTINIASFTIESVPSTTAPDGNSIMRVTITGAGNAHIMSPVHKANMAIINPVAMHVRQTSGAFRNVTLGLIQYTSTNYATSYGGAANSPTTFLSSGTWTRRTSNSNISLSPGLYPYAAIRLSIGSAQVGDVFEFDAAQWETVTPINSYNPALPYSVSGSESNSLSVSESTDITDPTTGDPIPGSESNSLSISESISIVVTQTVTDTAAVTVSETTSGSVTAVASDAAATAVSDISNITSTLPGQESVALSIVDTSVSSVTQPVAESNSLSVSESTVIFVQVSSSESNSLSTSEATASSRTIVASDAGSIAISDVSNVASTLPGQESIALAVVDTATSSVVQPASESNSVAVSESVAISVTVSGSESNTLSVSETTVSSRTMVSADTGSIASSEVSNVASTLPGQESIAVAVIDTSSIYVTTASTDAGSVSVSEAQASNLSSSRTDTGAIAVGEASASNLTVSRTDTGSLAVTDTSSVILSDTKSASDTGSISITESSQFGTVAVSASDTSAISTSEATAFVRDISASEAVSISVTETATPFANFPGQESGAVSVSESSSVEVSGTLIKSATETNALSTLDVANATVQVAGTETPSISVSDTSSLQISGTIQKSASDSFSIATAEVAGYDVFVSRTDTSEISVAETTSGNNTATSSDQGSIAVADSGNFGQVDRTASDSIAITVSETASQFFPAPGQDSAALQVTESTDIQFGGYIDYQGAESNTLSVSESSSLVVLTSSTDTGAIAVVDSTSFDTVPAVAAETAVLSVAEARTTLVTITRTDTSSILVAESRAFGTVDVSASDTSSLAVSETSTSALQAPGIESISVSISESASITTTFVAISRTDTGTLSIEEATSRFVSVTSSDSASISASSTVSFEQVPTAASETAFVSVAEATSIVVGDIRSGTDTLNVFVVDSASVDVSEGFVERSDDDAVTMSMAERSHRFIFGGKRKPISFDSNSNNDIMFNSKGRPDISFGGSNKGDISFE